MSAVSNVGIRGFTASPPCTATGLGLARHTTWRSGPVSFPWCCGMRWLSGRRRVACFWWPGPQRCSRSMRSALKAGAGAVVDLRRPARHARRAAGRQPAARACLRPDRRPGRGWAPAGSGRRASEAVVTGFADTVDQALEFAVVPSFTRIGYAARSRSGRWTPLDRYDLTGRVVVITGATSGLGLAAAQTLAGDGATLEIVARDEAKVIQVCQRLRNAGAPADRFRRRRYRRPGCDPARRRGAGATA